MFADENLDGSKHFIIPSNATINLPFVYLSLDPTLVLRKSIQIRIVSVSHGHIVTTICCNIIPQQFPITKTIKFYEPENSFKKTRIDLPSKYVNFVECGCENRVMFDYSKNTEEMNFRYKSPQFPVSGSCYILIYNDSYHSALREIWLVIVQSHLKLDVVTSIGKSVSLDLRVKGPRLGRRVRAFSSSPSTLTTPSSAMQLFPGVISRFHASFTPDICGAGRLFINLVDVESHELVSSWIILATVTPPDVLKTYEVAVSCFADVHKKITFKNPISRRRCFTLSSSDENIMKPRDTSVEVEGLSTAVIRLCFHCFSFSLPIGCDGGKVYLFLRDGDGMIGDVCFQFNISRDMAVL